MKKLLLSIFVGCVLLAGGAVLLLGMKGKKGYDVPAAGGVVSPGTQFDFPRETVVYDIKSLLGLKVGEARLSFEGATTLEDRHVILVTFVSRAVNVYDEEKIYADPETLYPVRVERDLDIWGKKEKITEYYDQDKGTVRIVKRAGERAEEQVLEGRAPVDNIYCFIYRYRKEGAFTVGESFRMNLPTKEVTVELKKETLLAAAGKEWESYYMETVPSEYRLWFARGEKKIPLRIDGSSGLKKVSMVMQEYQTPPEEKDGTQ